MGYKPVGLRKCPACHGNGHTYRIDMLAGFIPTGVIEKCNVCSGSGLVKRERKVNGISTCCSPKKGGNCMAS